MALNSTIIQTIVVFEKYSKLLNILINFTKDPGRENNTEMNLLE
jgi:hypothetical protein